MVLQHVILACGWILFSFLHSFLASISFKAFLSEKLGQGFRRYRLYYTLFATVSFFAVLLFEIRMRSFFVFIPTTMRAIPGMLTGLAGLIVMGVCVYKYFGRLSGIKTLFSSEVKTGNSLIITGIHRFIRHPLYAGTFLFIWGLFLFRPLCSLLISNCIITIYTLVGIRFEEEKLILEFGDQYLQYKKEVPMIIPSGIKRRS